VNNKLDLKEQTEILVKLQSIDSGKKKINIMLSRVDDQIKKLDLELDASRTIVVKSETALDDLRKKYRLQPCQQLIKERQRQWKPL